MHCHSPEDKQVILSLPTYRKTELHLTDFVTTYIVF